MTDVGLNFDFIYFFTNSVSLQVSVKELESGQQILPH